MGNLTQIHLLVEQTGHQTQKETTKTKISMNSTVAQSCLNSIHVMELTTHAHARTHAWKLRGEEMFIFKALKRFFFPPLLPTEKRKCTVLMGENLINMPPVCSAYCTENGRTKMLAHSWLHHSDKTSGQNTLSIKNRWRNHVMDNNAFSLKKYLQDKKGGGGETLFKKVKSLSYQFKNSTTYS